MASRVLALVNDLFFYSKIRQTAQQLGIELRPAEPASLAQQAAQDAPQAVLVELGPETSSMLEAVRALKSDPALASVRVVAFGSHVQTSVLQAARDAGCDEVLARSEFTARLPQILSS